MFLRRFQKRKNGRSHVYWALVESYRTSKGSRQRVVSYLGELQDSEQSGWAILSERLDAKKGSSTQARQLTFFDPPQQLKPEDDLLDLKTALVHLKGVRLERLRDFGDVWLAWGLWRMLGLDSLLEQKMTQGKEEIPWHIVAAILVIARLCEPSSELHIESTWYRRTALEDLLQVAPEKIHTDRLYTGLDRLLPHKEAIEQHVKQRLGELFALQYELLFYDVTSTYFEGQCKGNPQAKHGYSRDQRSDCLQVCIALIVTTDGMPVGYEVFSGNRHDSTTVQEMVESIEKKHGKADRIWVMDRGMISEDNLKFIRERGGRYIVGTPKASLRKFESHLVEKNWEEVESGVEVKLVPSPDGHEMFVLARSADRRAKETAIHERFIQRMENGLKDLETAMNSARLVDSETAHRRLGKLQGENSRASKAFDVKIEVLKKKAQTGIDDKQEPASQVETPQTNTTLENVKPKKVKKTKKPKEPKQPKLGISWERNKSWSEWAKLSEGCYLLRSNLIETDPKILWKQYIQLTDAEWAFRITKDELVLRPVWHHKEDRVKAHILVCFIAYVMWKTLSGWMSRSGLGDAPRTVLNAISKIKTGDVVLPIQSPDKARSHDLRLRCVTEPDEEQKLMLQRLGLTLPKRLGTAVAKAQM